MRNNQVTRLVQVVCQSIVGSVRYGSCQSTPHRSTISFTAFVSFSGGRHENAAISLQYLKWTDAFTSCYTNVASNQLNRGSINPTNILVLDLATTNNMHKTNKPFKYVATEASDSKLSSVRSLDANLQSIPSVSETFV